MESRSVHTQRFIRHNKHIVAPCRQKRVDTLQDLFSGSFGQRNDSNFAMQPFHKLFGPVVDQARGANDNNTASRGATWEDARAEASEYMVSESPPSRLDL